MFDGSVQIWITRFLITLIKRSLKEKRKKKERKKEMFTYIQKESIHALRSCVHWWVKGKRKILFGPSGIMSWEPRAETFPAPSSMGMWIPLQFLLFPVALSNSQWFAKGRFVICDRMLVCDKMLRVDLRSYCWMPAQDCCIQRCLGSKVSRAQRGCALIAAIITVSFYQNTFTLPSKTFALLKTAHHEMHINEHACSMFTVCVQKC